MYEVNNFQTAAHFDWVPPIFVAQQGDLVVFRWTGEHNVVQVHDAGKDVGLPGGVRSSVGKTNCVGGPNYSCINGAPSLGEFVFDTTDYRPGLVHISDEFAMTGTGHTTGMNMEVDLRFAVPLDTPVPPVKGSCCALDKTKGADCRVVEIYNANDGAQLDSNVAVGAHDIVRFRWAGGLKIVQTLPKSASDDSPSMMAKPGGVAMPASVECIPGPAMSCLGGNTAAAVLLFDVADQIAKNNYDTTMYGAKFFNFYATGDDMAGFTSSDTGSHLYVDDSIPYDPTAACPSM